MLYGLGKGGKAVITNSTGAGFTVLIKIFDERIDLGSMLQALDVLCVVTTDKQQHDIATLLLTNQGQAT